MLEGMLQVQGLRSSYGQIPVLHGVDFHVEQGEVLGILGHNGMGKSTLIRTLMGYLPATDGSIMFEGRDITRAATHNRARAGLGYVPQGRRIFPDLTVMENMEMGGVRQSKDKIDYILSLFPRLHNMLDRQGGALSGGEQQILALARALCAAPKLVFLDEPTEGIQPSIIEQIGELLHRLVKELNLTIVVVEQNFDFITDLSTRVAILQKGEIVRSLTPAELLDEGVIDEFVGMEA